MSTQADTVVVFRRRFTPAGGAGAPVWRYYWHRKSSNGRKLSGGLEPFVSLRNCVKAAKRANEGGTYDLAVPQFDTRGNLVGWLWQMHDGSQVRQP